MPLDQITVRTMTPPMRKKKSHFFDFIVALQSLDDGNRFSIFDFQVYPGIFLRLKLEAIWKEILFFCSF